MGDRFRDELKELDIEAQVDNIFGIRVLNISKYFNSVGSGPYPGRCCFWLEMQTAPKFEGYHFLDEKYLVSYDKKTGAITSFEYIRGTKDGFAGRTITLPVYGFGKVFKNKGITKIPFKGSLWISAAASQAAADFFKTETCSVAYTEWNKKGCGVSIDLDVRVFYMKLKMAGLAMQGPSCMDELTAA